MNKLLSFIFISVFFCALSCAAEGEKISSNYGVNMKISIQVTSDSGSHKLTATLVDNSSATAFYKLLYGNFEKVGPLGTKLPRNDTQITTQAGDIILYQGNQITIYYDTNSWNFTRLGKVDGVTQAQIKKILGKGDVSAVFEILK